MFISIWHTFSAGTDSLCLGFSSVKFLIQISSRKNTSKMVESLFLNHLFRCYSVSRLRKHRTSKILLFKRCSANLVIQFYVDYLTALHIHDSFLRSDNGCGWEVEICVANCVYNPCDVYMKVFWFSLLLSSSGLWGLRFSVLISCKGTKFTFLTVNWCEWLWSNIHSLLLILLQLSQVSSVPTRNDCFESMSIHNDGNECSRSYQVVLFAVAK